MAPRLTPSVREGAVLEGRYRIDALIALLDARERCIRDLSVLCLDDVGQIASAALAADQDLVRRLQSGEESSLPWVVSRAQLSISERLGDSVLLTVDDAEDSEPASILMMRSEAGWRIRDYLER